MALSDDHRRYLRLLGFDTPPNGLDGLRRIVHAQVSRVPFENVSKLLLFGRERRGRITTLSEYLDGIEHSDLGGTCYTANPYFAELLQAIGYDPDLLGATMSTPNVHTCIRVRLAGAEYHVDVGFGAPFRTPVALDQLPAEITDGYERFLLRRSDDNGELTVGVYSGRDRLHGYRVHDVPRSFDFFHQTILDSYARGKTFMSCLRIARFSETGSAHLRDRLLTITEGGKQSAREIANMEELEAAAAGPLGMPRCRINEAVSVLEEVTGQRFFRNE